MKKDTVWKRPCGERHSALNDVIQNGARGGAQRDANNPRKLEKSEKGLSPETFRMTAV